MKKKIRDGIAKLMHIPIGKRSYYEVLGVGMDSTNSEIRDAYRCKLLENHPDKTKDRADADTEINLIQLAYKVLSDENSRLEYDLSLDDFTKTQGLLINGEGLDIFSLEDFEEENDIFYKQCPRCTSDKAMKLTEEDLINGTTDGDGNYEVIVQCSDCSLWIKVQYAEEDE